MADEGNEDSWLYGKAEGGGEGGQEEDQRESDGGAAGKKNGSAEQSAAEDGGSPGRKKRPRSSFSDEEQHHQQHDDNAMDSSDLVPAEDDGDRREEEEFQGEEDSHLQEEGGNRSDGEMDSDDSDDDDDINVVIRPTGPSYNIIKPRGPIIPPQAAPAAPQDKSKQPAGKFSIDEFESVGTINGVPAHEFSIDSLDEKPWRKPGSDITDYFNYGFNEETWRAYCERQKRMRMHESGVGLQGLTINNPQAAQAPNNWRGPPPPRKMNNGIDVIGGMNMHQRPDGDMMPRHPKENVIQVMTADRREYSRSAAKFDSMGAPFGGPQDFYPHESDYGDYGYEPTQADQWNQESQWQPHGIKTLTPGPPMMQGGMGMPPPHMMPPPMSMGPPGMGHHGMRSHDRDRDRSRRSRDHDREHRREHRDRDRDRDRDRGDRESVSVKVEGESSRSSRSDKTEDKEKRSSSKSDRHKDRYRERSRSREKSKSRRRSRSRDRERHGGGSSSGGGGAGSSSSSSRSEKKKSHRKDKEEDE